jgi:GNAT superfamily N-acetyltransferase
MGDDQRQQSSSRITAEEVSFSEASADQLTAVWTLNAAVWAEPFSTKEHIERERILSQQPASRERWKTWVLTSTSKPGEIVASVETFERPLLVGSDRGCRVEKGYGIASVFTNPKYRGNRMADVLLSRLKDWLDSKGRGWVSVLYSDIGAVCPNLLSDSSV